MRKALLAASAALLLVAGPAMAQQKTIKIGFVSTFSGPVAVIGNDMRNSVELALDHLGRKMGGLPVEVIYEDDGFKPEVGKQKTDKLIESDKVDFISGYIWSNVLLASLKPIVDSKTFLVIANAGPSQIAGELCSPTVFSTSWNNDQTPQAMGTYMNQKGVKSVFLIGPNYAAGKDMLAGVASTFKGKVIGQELTTWPAQLDFSAELAKAKAAKPDAIFVFYPGRAGVQFLTQYAQAGLKGAIPLYTAFTIDELSLPLQKELALGVPGAQQWVNDLPNEANKKFVADYIKKYPGHKPAFYGAQSYDAIMLIASAVAATKGKLDDKAAVQKALEKADFKSVRGNFKFGKNHVPIQNFYLQDVVKDAKGDFVLKTVATIVKDNQDIHHAKCPMK
ncbi:MAG: ABC transporter substrate-binding protein [Pseudolabrys sp.]|nr:ABC transporter substrate-binding protein [Pseudolabrys sp.]MSP31612.1 ABC transporter substrate-binding protein [Pseudolabrys sp.]